MDDYPLSPDMWSEEADTEHLNNKTSDEDEGCLAEDYCFSPLFKTPLSAPRRLGTPLNRSLSLSNLKPRISQIPESLLPIVNQHDISWTSSLATPVAGDICNSSANFNTEERKVLLPCRDETTGRRILFPHPDPKKTPGSSSTSTRRPTRGKLLQSTPASNLRDSLPSELPLSPISGPPKPDVHHTPLSSARLTRNRRFSTESRHLEPVSTTTATEEDSPSILGGHQVVTLSPPKSPVIGKRLTSRRKHGKKRLELPSQEPSRTFATQHSEAEHRLLKSKKGISNLSDPLTGTCSSKATGDGVQMMRAPLKDVEVFQKLAPPRRQGNEALVKSSGRCRSVLGGRSGVSQAVSVDCQSVRKVASELTSDCEIASSPVISSRKIKRKRKRGRLSLTPAVTQETEFSSSGLDNNPKSRDSPENSVSSTSEDTLNLHGTLAAPSSAHSGFASQNDLSINTMQEIFKATDLLQSMDHATTSAVAEQPSKKLKFASTAKSPLERKASPDLELRCIKSRVQRIKTNSGASCFLYPSVAASDGPRRAVDAEMVGEYSRLLEAAAKLDKKVARRAVPMETGKGFVRFSELPQGVALAAGGEPSSRADGNAGHYAAKVLRSKKAEEHTEITCTQMSRLVEDAERMFETEDSQWGLSVTSGRENVRDTLDRRENSSTPVADVVSICPTRETSSVDEMDTPKTLPCGGFTSASGKKLSISDAAIKKARSVFGEEDFPSGLDTPKGSGRKMADFTSAHGKKLNISKVAMDNARKLFGDLDYTANDKDASEDKAMQVNVSDCHSVESSSTVSAAVAFSAGKMPDSRTLLADPLLREDANFDSPNMVDKFTCGFTSGSGKKFTVSDAAMKRARSLFQDVDSPVTETKDVDTPKPNNPMGFSSASGKKFIVSDAAMTRARSLFQDVDSPVTETKDVDTPKPNIPMGFSSASGKKFTVSDAAMKRARSLFQDVDSPVTETKDVDTPKPNIPMGFSSASGKKFTVSDAAMKRARSLFQDVDSPVTETKDIDTPKPNIPMGFSSASGKKFTVSDAAMTRARSLFQDVDSPVNETKDVATPEMRERIPMGFSSASGKKLIISEESLANARILFDDVPSFSESSDVNTPQPNCKMPLGFSSASGKECRVSDASIKKARTLFGDQESNERPRTPTELHPNRLKNSAFKRPTSTEVTNKPTKLTDIQETDVACHDERLPFEGFFAASGQQMPTVSEASLREVEALFSRKCQDSAKKDYGCSIITPNVAANEIEIEEVMQATEALLADEESGVPLWITTYTSSPSVATDRMDLRQPMLDGKLDAEAPSLGQHDRFRGRKLKCVKPAPPKEDPTAFKTPYLKSRDSAAVGKDSAKRGGDFEFGTPFAKRARLDSVVASTTAKPTEMSSEEVARLREEAWSSQRAEIKTKDSLSRRPCLGSHLLRKQGRLLAWKTLTHGHPPGNFSRTQLLKLGVRGNVADVNAGNAAQFVFVAQNHYGPNVCRSNTHGLPVGDAARLILDPQGRADVDRVESAFLTSPGVDPKLVPEGWVQNHLRWIVWKLAATEKSFPRQFAGRCLTPNVALLQLKYRYDREIDRCERPALRRVLEQDDPASRRLVLCVARVARREGDGHGFELELTDGWYSVVASLDSELSRLVGKGVVTVGTKLMIHGAELSSREPCYPLECKLDVRLRLSANSTRRARWHARLGFQRQVGPMRLGLRSILARGGTVGRVDVWVVRVYPTLHVETLEGGAKVTRSEAAEERAAVLFARQRQDRVEAAYIAAQAELRNATTKTSRGCGARDFVGVTSGSQLCEMLDQAADPTSMQELLTDEQLSAVEQHRHLSSESAMRQVEARVQHALAEGGDKRNVATLLKLRCVDVNAADCTTSAVLSVWRAPDDLAGLLREAAVVSVFNVVAAGSRDGCLQLTAGRQTRYQALNSSNTMPDCLARRLTSFREAAAPAFCPPFSELDVVGVVTLVVDGNARLQTVYIADLAQDFLGVAVWNGLKNCALDELLRPGAVVAVSNLQWRPGPQRRVPHVHAADTSAFARCPRQPHLRHALDELSAALKRDCDFVANAREKLLAVLHDTTTPTIPPRGASTFPTESKQTPVTPRPEPVNDDKPSPAQQRIERLSCYSDPPPLPPLSITTSQRTSKEFRLPARRVPEEMDASQEIDSPPLSLE